MVWAMQCYLVRLNGDEIAKHFEILPGTRQIICVKINAVKSACGYSVPFFNYSGERDTLQKWAISTGRQGLVNYQHEKNFVSMDGIVTP